MAGGLGRTIPNTQRRGAAIPTHSNTKQGQGSGPIIPRNKSPQTPQADSMYWQHSEEEHAASKLITERGSVKQTGTQGGSF
jgi:hypothetical protein